MAGIAGPRALTLKLKGVKYPKPLYPFSSLTGGARVGRERKKERRDGKERREKGEAGGGGRGGGKEDLELQEQQALRASLGLKPLRQ